jgi:hypothetical protein
MGLKLAGVKLKESGTAAAMEYLAATRVELPAR